MRYLRFAPVPWSQYCDGRSWESKLVFRYQVKSIPDTFLLDRQGRILARGLRGKALDEAVARALGVPESFP